MSSRNDGSRRSALGSGRKRHRPWREKLSTKIIACVVAVSLVITVPIFAIADEADPASSSSATANVETQGGTASQAGQSAASEGQNQTGEASALAASDTGSGAQELVESANLTEALSGEDAQDEMQVEGASSWVIKLVTKYFEGLVDAITTEWAKKDGDNALSVGVDGEETVIYIYEYSFPNADGSANWNPTYGGGLVVHGHVTLVIKDGVTFTVGKDNYDNSICEAGILVNGEGNSLTICAGNDADKEVRGTGRLIAYGGYQSAGIGGSDNTNRDRPQDGTNITIEGANVEAYGGQDAAGIGGGNKGCSDNIVINGGTVTAKGGTYAAGIGSGKNGGTWNSPTVSWYQNDGQKVGGQGITINGGTVTATGGADAAGIGGGLDSDGHNIEIAGGKVVAKGGSGAAGIGCGINSVSSVRGYNIHISGGTVTATGAKYCAAIGSAQYEKSWGILIDGDAKVYATAGAMAAAIGGGANCCNVTKYIEIGGNAYVEANKDGDSITEGLYSGEMDYTGIGSGVGDGGETCSDIKICGNAEVHAWGMRGAGIGSGRNGQAGDITLTGNCKVYATNRGYSGKAGSAIGTGCNYAQTGTVTIQNTGDIHVEAHTIDKYTAIGWGKKDSGAGNQDVSIAKGLTVYSGSPFTKLFTSSSSDNCKNKIKGEEHLLITNDAFSGPTLSAEQTSGNPTVGYESTTSYELDSNFVYSASDYEIVWYRDATGLLEGGAPAYASVKKGVSSFDVCTCPDQSLASTDYGVTPAGTYYFKLKGSYCGQTCYSDVLTYTVEQQAVYVTSGSATKAYDGTPLKCETVTQNEAVIAKKTSATDGSPAFEVKDTVIESTYGFASQTELGSCNNTFEYTLKSAYAAGNYKIVKSYGMLKVQNQYPTVIADDVSCTYDGTAHHITIKKIIDKNGKEIKASSCKVYFQTSTDAMFWSDEQQYSTASDPLGNVTATNFGSVYVRWRVVYNGVSYAYGNCGENSMAIARRSISLTSETATKEYDGTPLTRQKVTQTGDGFVGNEGFSAEPEAQGTMTTVGSCINDISYQLKENTNPENYTITKYPGLLTVTKKSAPITISTPSASKVYDGTQLVADTYSYTQGVLVDGDSLSVEFTSSVMPDPGSEDEDERAFNAGTYSNSLASYMVRNEWGDDVTACYTFAEPDYGTLTIYQRQLTLTSGSDLKVKTQASDYARNENVMEGGDGLAADERLTYSGFPTVTEVSYTPTENTFTYAAAAGSKFNASNYKITQSFGNLMLVEEMSIVGEDQTFTYDGTQHKAPVALVDNGQGASVVVEYATSADGKTWSAYSTSVPTITDAGTLYIKAKATKGVQVKEASYTATVNPRQVTISTTSATKAYDGAELTANTKSDYTVSGQGFVAGQGATVTITGAQTFVGSSANAFTYDLTGGAKAENYTISEQPGTLTVTKNASPIAITTASSTQAYNGTPLSSTGYTATWAGVALDADGVLCDGDVLCVTPTGSITNVGTALNTVEYRVLRGTQDVTACYTFEEPTLGTLRVTPRAIVITTTSASKVYDGTALTKNNTNSAAGSLDYTVTGEGFIAGQGFASVTITGARTDAGTAANTVTYELNAATDASNYKISTSLGTLTVEKRKVTVTSGSAASTWDACPAEGLSNTSACTVAGDGFVAGELAEGYPKGAGSLAKPDSEPALGSPVTAENAIAYSWTGNGNPANYEITECCGTLLIANCEASTAVASDYVGIYDGQGHLSEFTSTLPEGATVSYEVDGVSNLSAEQAKAKMKDVKYDGTGNVASYNVTLTITSSGTPAKVATCSYKVTINPRELTITAGSATKVYDGTALTCADYVIGGDGFVAGEEQAIKMTAGSTLTDANSCRNEIVKLGNNGAFKVSNYDISYVSGTLTVTKRPVIIYSLGLGLDKNAIEGMSAELVKFAEEQGVFGTLLYDGKDQSQAVTIEVGKGQVAGIPVIEGMGFVEGQGASISGFQEFTNAGTYSNTFDLNLNFGTSEANYDIKTIYGVVKITPRSIVLSSADDQKMYDGAPLANDQVTVLGDKFAAGEGADYNVTGRQTEVGASANSFTYALWEDSLLNTIAGKKFTNPINYNIEIDEGSLVVYTNDTLRIEAKTQEYTYDGNPHGDAAKAFIGDELCEDAIIWYSVDGGLTYSDDVAQLTEPGTLDVLVRVDKSGYERAEAAYKIIVTKADTPAVPTTGDSTSTFMVGAFAIFAASAAALALAWAMRRRRNH